MKLLTHTLAAVAFAAATAVALPALAAGDWIKFGGIDGETKAIALDKVEWRAMPTTGCSGTLAAGSLIIGGDLSAVAPVKTFKRAVMFVRKAGEPNALKVQFEKIVISSATPTTAQNSSAVVSLGKLGRVEYQGGSWSREGCQG